MSSRSEVKRTKVTPDKVIDIQGRIWISERGIFQLSEGHPKLNPSQRFNLKENEDVFFLTDEGKIYNLHSKTIIDLPYTFKEVLSSYHSVACLTIEGTLLVISREGKVFKIFDDILHILGVDSSGDETTCSILAIDKQGEWKQIYIKDDNINADIATPPTFKLDRLIKIVGGNVITMDSYIRFRHYRDGKWITEKIDLPDVADVFNKDLGYFGMDIILLNDGRLLAHHNYINKIIHCNNRDLIEKNLQYKWVKLTDLFKGGDFMIGLVNEIGEIYKLNHNFLFSSTNLPTEIYALPPIKVKNARNK